MSVPSVHVRSSLPTPPVRPRPSRPSTSVPSVHARPVRPRPSRPSTSVHVRPVRLRPSTSVPSVHVRPVHPRPSRGWRINKCLMHFRILFEVLLSVYGNRRPIQKPILRQASGEAIMYDLKYWNYIVWPTHVFYNPPRVCFGFVYHAFFFDSKIYNCKLFVGSFVGADVLLKRYF
jgi:hypothetical protein